jgi:HEPN domain-containing protein
MKRIRPGQALALAAVLTFAACSDEDPLAPLTDDTQLALEDRVALEVLQDTEAMESTLAYAELGTNAAARHGMAHGQRQAANELTNQARVRFQAARDALANGERVRAADEAREGRRLVAQAMQMSHGTRGMASLVERAEELAAEVAGDPGAFHQSEALLGELHAFNERARIRLQQRDSTGAGALGVLAQQRHQQRMRHDPDPAARHERARLAVGLADAAVVLATRLIEAGEPDPEQLRYLEAANEYLSNAGLALEAGEDRRAIYLAEHAQWAALKAVVLPGGVTDEEARAMSELARRLYADAEAAVGSEPTELQLTRARHLIEAGEAKLAEGYHRGIGALWRAAVICSWLLS